MKFILIFILFFIKFHKNTFASEAPIPPYDANVFREILDYFLDVAKPATLTPQETEGNLLFLKQTMGRYLSAEMPDEKKQEFFFEMIGRKICLLKKLSSYATTTEEKRDICQKTTQSLIDLGLYFNTLTKSTGENQSYLTSYAVSLSKAVSTLTDLRDGLDQTRHQREIIRLERQLLQLLLETKEIVERYKRVTKEPEDVMVDIESGIHARIAQNTVAGKEQKKASLEYLKHTSPDIKAFIEVSGSDDAAAQREYRRHLAERGGRIGKLAAKNDEKQKQERNRQLLKAGMKLSDLSNPLENAQMLFAIQKSRLQELLRTPITDLNLQEIMNEVEGLERDICTSSQKAAEHRRYKSSRSTNPDVLTYEYLEKVVLNTGKEKDFHELQAFSQNVFVLYLMVGKIDEARRHYEAFNEYLALKGKKDERMYELITAHLDALAGDSTKLLDILDKKKKRKSAAQRKHIAEAKKAVEATKASDTKTAVSDEEDGEEVLGAAVCAKKKPVQVDPALYMSSSFVSPTKTEDSHLCEKTKKKRTRKKKTQLGVTPHDGFEEDTEKFALASGGTTSTGGSGKPDDDSENETTPSGLQFVQVCSAPTVTREEKPKSFSLAELFNLTARSRKVDSSIFTGQWKFTRDHFKTYMESLGCTHRNGKGSHELVSISDIFERNGRTIMAMAEIGAFFGGSLTLPNWDDDFVPYYLRPQIEKIRLTLRTLKMAELETVSSAASGAPLSLSKRERDDD